MYGDRVLEEVLMTQLSRYLVWLMFVGIILILPVAEVLAGPTRP